MLSKCASGSASISRKKPRVCMSHFHIKLCEVTPDEWTGLKRQLRQTYQRVLAMLRDLDRWDDETAIGGALAIVVHTAYHLGEIRQALCTLK